MLKLLLLVVIFILAIVCVVKTKKMMDSNSDIKTAYWCSLAIAVLTFIVLCMCAYLELFHTYKKSSY